MGKTAPRRLRGRVALGSTLALAGLAYSLRLGVPALGAEPPHYLFDEAYTAFSAHRLLIGDTAMFTPAARRFEYAARGWDDLSPTSRAEWSHPPGAPAAIAAGVALFGFNAWAARLATVFASLATLLATASMAGRRRAWAACALVAFDGAFFVLARTAMPPALMTAGIVAGAAMLMRALAGGQKRWVLTAGPAFGFASSVRWTAVPIVLTLLAAACASVEGRRRRLLPYCAACLGIAAATYVCFYAPYFLQGHGLGELARLHLSMLWFHRHLPPGLARTAPWYEWPWQLHPIVFGIVGSPDRPAVVWCEGCRLLWWLLPPALVWATWRARRLHARWLLPASAIGATWLPWALINRFGMAYYLITALPFAACIVTASLPRGSARRVAAGCVTITALWFLAVYPVLAAVPIPRPALNLYARVLGGPTLGGEQR